MLSVPEDPLAFDVGTCCPQGGADLHHLGGAHTVWPPALGPLCPPDFLGPSGRTMLILSSSSDTERLSRTRGLDSEDPWGPARARPVVR